MNRSANLTRRLAGNCLLLVGIVAVALAGVGCRSTQKAPTEQTPTWDLARPEFLEWRADDQAFDQDRALEASGMMTVDESLLITSEKYARLLMIDVGRSMAASVVRLDVPRHSELEGITVHGSKAYVCDEAYAAVHEIDLSTLESGGPLPSRSLPLHGVSVPGGKIGFEGIAITRDGSMLYLLLERTGNPALGCVSRIFKLTVGEDSLTAEGEAIDITLEDCAWRLTGLFLWQDRLLALKTRYPDARYQVITIDPQEGSWEVAAELTDLLLSVTSQGWGNNMEGIAVAGDGTLFLVADNAETGVIDLPEPPPARDRTLLLRIPRAEQ
jgi:hypothetical protein